MAGGAGSSYGWERGVLLNSSEEGKKKSMRRKLLEVFTRGGRKGGGEEQRDYRFRETCRRWRKKELRAKRGGASRGDQRFDQERG